MLSSAGLNNLQLRSTLLLAAVVLASLAVSLLLAFAVATAPRPTAEIPIAAPAAQPPAVSRAAVADAEHDQPPPLWALLAPWAFTVDAIAALGLAAVLVVRYHARRRRGARM